MRVSAKEALRLGWVDKTTLKGNASHADKGTKPSSSYRKRNRREVEGEEQAQLIERFRAQYPDVGHLLIHIPNGGSRKNAFEGWRLKTQGVKAGVSDLFLPVARKGFHGLWIEFKACPPFTAQVSVGQRQWIDLMRAQGYAAHVCVGVENAMVVLGEYLS